MRTKTLATGLAGAIIILGAGAVGAGLIAQNRLTREVDAWLAAPPFTKASHGKLHFGLLKGRVEIDDLAVESASPALQSLRAAHLDIDGGGPGFFFGSGPDLRLAALGAQQVELTTGALHVSADGLSMTGVSLAGGAGHAAMTNDLVETLRRLSIDRLEADKPHLSTKAKGGHDAEFTTLVLEHLDKGHGASLTATHGSLIEEGGADPGIAAMRVEDLRMTGIDFLDMRWIAQPAQDDSMATLVDSASATKFLLAIDSGSIAVDSMSLSGLRAPPGTWPPAAGSGAEAGSALGTLGLDRLELSNFELSSDPSIGTHLSVGHAALDKLQPGSLGRLAIDALALKNPRGIGHLGSFELAELTYGHQALPLGLPQFFVKRLHLADFSAGAKAGAELGIQDAAFDMEGGLDDPRSVRFKIGPILVPATLAPPLTAAGYNELVLDYEGASRYDTAEGVVEGTQRLVAHDAGTLALSLRFEHYPTVSDAHDAATVGTKFLQAELAHLELRYDDASLIDRLLKFQAVRTGSDVEHAREALLNLVAAQREALAGTPELLAGLDAIAAFLRQPRSLTLILAPPKPVAVGALMTLAQSKPDQVSALLGVSIR